MKKKDNTISVRLTETEKEKLDWFCKEMECNQSEVIVKLINQKDIIILPHAKEILKLLIEAIYKQDSQEKPLEPKEIVERMDKICQLLGTLITQINSREI